MELILNPARADVLNFCLNLSRTDAFEVSLTAGISEDEVSKHVMDTFSPDFGEYVYGIKLKDNLIALGGYNVETGLAWFLLSREVVCLGSAQEFQLARLLYQMRDKAIAGSKVGHIHNFMLAPNRQHKDFLTKLGAEFGQPVTLSGHEFLPFTIK